MRYWLMKSEPDEFSIQDLQQRKNQTEGWDGVRNYQARNFMRDDMSEGDLAFFYHSNTKVPGVVGIMRVSRAGYPDDKAFDPKDAHYDPKSDPDKPRWYRVDVTFERELDQGSRRRARRFPAGAQRQSAIRDAGRKGTLGLHPRTGKPATGISSLLRSLRVASPQVRS
jgi:predicted RNA-binding protein with PUA-like domain